jgi:hypothetical protein
LADYNLHIEKLKGHFSGTSHFHTRDVREFYRSFDKDLKTSTINWRIHHLVNQGVLRRMGRGVFQLGKSKIFSPVLSEALKATYKKLKIKFPYAEICVWNTAFLNNMMVHQAAHFFTLVETEREVIDPVFQEVRELKQNVYLNPNRETLRDYVQGNHDAIIIKPLITESPLQEVDSIKTPSIEKILVDLFCDTDLYKTYQGAEMKNIYKEVFSRYTINEKTLLRYANRRKRKKRLIQYLDRLDVLTTRNSD